MIQPTVDEIDAIVDTTRAWPSEARAQLTERLKSAEDERSSQKIPLAGGPTAAEVTSRFGKPGPGPSDETIARWIDDRTDHRGGR